MTALETRPTPSTPNSDPHLLARKLHDPANRLGDQSTADVFRWAASGMPESIQVHGFNDNRPVGGPTLVALENAFWGASGVEVPGVSKLLLSEVEGYVDYRSQVEASVAKAIGETFILHHLKPSLLTTVESQDANVHGGKMRRSGGEFSAHPRRVKRIAECALIRLGMDLNTPKNLRRRADALAHDTAEDTRKKPGIWLAKQAIFTPTVYKATLMLHGMSEEAAAQSASTLRRVTRLKDFEGKAASYSSYREDIINSGEQDPVVVKVADHLDNLVFDPDPRRSDPDPTIREIGVERATQYGIGLKKLSEHAKKIGIGDLVAAVTATTRKEVDQLQERDADPIDASVVAVALRDAVSTRLGPKKPARR